jgi:outer membrane protein TolC
LSAKNAQASAQIQYNNALTLLKMAMFYPLDQPIDLKETATDLLAKASLKNTGNIASNTNLILLQQQVEIDALNLKNKKSAYLPTLGGYFQQSYNAFRNEFDFFSDKPWFSQTVWGLQLSIPVFSSGQRKAQVEQAKIVVLQDENNYKITENALKMQEIQAINNLLGAQQKMQLQQENIRLAGKIYDNSILKQQIGKENSINVTQKYNQLMIAQSQYVGSLVDVFQSKLTLDKLYNQILNK